MAFNWTITFVRLEGEFGEGSHSMTFRAKKFEL